MRVLMIGVDKSTKGGMWTVVQNYLNDIEFVKKNNLIYIPTSITKCGVIKKLYFTIKAYIRIFMIFKETKIDILHVHMSEKGSVKRKGYIMRYAKRKGTKILLHMHGAEFEEWYNQLSIKKQYKIKKIINLADKTIILGNYLKSFISDLIIKKNTVEVVHNAVKVPDINKYNVKSNRILFLGQISKRKGIYILLDALTNIDKQITTRCRVDVFGPLSIVNIEKEIEKRGLGSFVHYGGWIDNKKKEEILENTMINILPSYNEGLPMTLIESMSYGIPSVTTNVAAIPEVVTINNGIIIKPGDVKQLREAIIKLALDEDFRIKLSAKAYKDAVEKFSLKIHIDKIQHIYNNLTK